MVRDIIGVDPHKLSATIEVVDHREQVLASGRLATDKAGYAAMRKHVSAWPDRVWAVEGSNGAPWSRCRHPHHGHHRRRWHVPRRHRRHRRRRNVRRREKPRSPWGPRIHIRWRRQAAESRR
jgi:hypothetical protein